MLSKRPTYQKRALIKFAVKLGGSTFEKPKLGDRVRAAYLMGDWLYGRVTRVSVFNACNVFVEVKGKREENKLTFFYSNRHDILEVLKEKKLCTGKKQCI